jgi:plastocyanin
MRASVKVGLAAVVAVIATGCGGSSSSGAAAPAPASGFFIVISNMSFSPLNLQAPAGATVTVVNHDSTPHSVTSEASPNAFTPGLAGGVSFDTGVFTGTRSFQLPSGVANGTVIPYYCTVHKGTMNTPNGAITINSAAQPTAAPGTSGTPGY